MGRGEHMGPTWSDEEKATITRLWPTAVAFSEIHKLFPGRTRSALCGQAGRMSLARPANATKPKPHKAERPTRPPPAPKPPPPPKPEPKSSPVAVAPTPLRRWPDLPPGGGKDLVELAAGDCKFPVGQESGERQRFCAAPAEPGQPYCGGCCARAYNAKPKADLRGLRRVA